MDFKFKITKNENSITVLLLPVIFRSATYLYEKFGLPIDKAYHFGIGTIKADYKTGVQPMVQKIAEALNEVCGKNLGNERIVFSDLFNQKDADIHPLFTFDTDKEGKATAETAISCRPKGDAPFMFFDLAGNQPVPQGDAFKYAYALELEVKAYISEKTHSKSVFAIFHRGVMCSVREDVYAKNDAAWEGFDFGLKTVESKPAAPAEGNLDDVDFPF